ncbi:2-oxo-4-hydroxy-4-carboxy-5-ureidoimidazoline decarboxylase [Mycobacterium sp. WMMD1722]|uniref:2-oxo-4-hydroxy-4-carboxy-5-ureidoimidazoline decarboxylase n=1 Tax=Mycobacterium sp. WMMD1722 TaxID=3404117 RepID=UPI003BF61C14
MTSPDRTPDIVGFNARLSGCSDADRAALLSAVCASPRWVRDMLAGAPFDDAEALLTRADQVLDALPDDELLVALDGHPRIGARPDNPSSAREQSAVADADTELRGRLAAANRRYEARFGHVYLVAANGRSAEELLTVLHERLGNDAATERRVLRTELGKINRLRLWRLLSEPEIS